MAHLKSNYVSNEVFLLKNLVYIHEYMFWFRLFPLLSEPSLWGAISMHCHNLVSHQLPFSVLAWCIGDITHNAFLNTDWDVFDWSKISLVVVLQFIFVGQILDCFQLQWLIRLFRSSKRQTNLVMSTLQSLEDITGHLRKTHWSRCSEWTMGINAELVNFFTYTDRDREIGSNLLV